MSFFLQICNLVDRDFLAQIGNRIYAIKANLTYTFEYVAEKPISIGWERGDFGIGGIIALVAKSPGVKVCIYERYVSHPRLPKYKASLRSFLSLEENSLKSYAKSTFDLLEREPNFKIVDQKEENKLMQMITLHEQTLEKNERRFKNGSTNAELDREEENEKIDKECVFCMEKDANAFSQECIHVVLCSDCAKALVAQNRKECPVCRVKIEKFYIKN